MAGRGGVPKDATTRRRRNVPARGEWQSTQGIGWMGERRPEPPDGLMPASQAAWDVWMTSWIAAHWTPADLPGLRQLIRLYDQVERGQYVRIGELRLWSDTFGLTPKGRQDRRWLPPREDERAATSAPPLASPYAHLKVVMDD